MSQLLPPRPRRRRSRLLALLAALVTFVSLVGMTAPSFADTGTGTGATGTAGLFVPANGRLGSTVLPPASWRSFPVLGQLGIPTSGVSAVSVTLNVAAGPETDIYAAPDDPAHPSFLAVHYQGFGTTSNSAVVAVGANGSISLETVAPNVVVFVDLQGYYTSGTTTAPGGYVPVTPYIAANTMTGGTGLPPIPLNPNQTSVVNVPKLPTPVSAIFANIYVNPTRPGGSGWFTPYPDGGTKPDNQIAFSESRPVSMGTIISVNNQTGKFDLYYGGGTGAVQINVMIQVLGYFTPTATLGAFTPAAGSIYDSKGATIAAGATVKVPVAGIGGAPAVGNSLLAAALNFRVSSAASGSLAVGASDRPLPLGAAASFSGGDQAYSTLSNVPISGDGSINVKNNGTSPINLLVDLEGWYTGTRLPISVDPDGTIRYNNVFAYGLNMPDLTTVAESGAMQSDGTCLFSSSSAAVENSGDVYNEVATYNPTTCQRTLVHGSLSADAIATLTPAVTGGTTPTPVPATVQQLPPGPAPAVAAAAAPSLAAPSPAGGVPNTAYIQAYDKSAYIDPLFITITSLSVNLTYARGQGFILGSGYSGYAYDYAFKYDGWSKSGLQNNNLGVSSTWVNYSVNETFRNDDFEEILIRIFGVAAVAACGFDTSTAVFYLNPRVTGNADGTYTWGHNNSVKGGCSNLVHFHNWHDYGHSN